MSRRQGAKEHQQDRRADEGDHDRADQARATTEAQKARDEAAQKCADDADENVAEHTKAMTPYRVTGQEARAQPDDEPRDNSARIQCHRPLLQDRLCYQYSMIVGLLW